MLSTYLSPAGRMSPSDFKKSALILIVVGVLFSIPELLGIKSLSALAGIVSFALIYPWIVIWIKRYHDGGKSGWMCFLLCRNIVDASDVESFRINLAKTSHIVFVRI